MTRTQAGSLDQGIDPGAAARSQQKSGRMVDPVLRVAVVQHDAEPTLENAGRNNPEEERQSFGHVFGHHAKLHRFVPIRRTQEPA